MTLAAPDFQATSPVMNSLIVHQVERIAYLEALVNQGLEVTDIFTDMFNSDGEPSPSELALFAQRVAFFREDCRRAFI